MKIVLRDLADGGIHNTIAGQPTDDSEMALMPTRTLIERGRFDLKAIKNAYRNDLRRIARCGVRTGRRAQSLDRDRAQLPARGRTPRRVPTSATMPLARRGPRVGKMPARAQWLTLRLNC